MPSSLKHGSITQIGFRQSDIREEACLRIKIQECITRGQGVPLGYEGVGQRQCEEMKHEVRDLVYVFQVGTNTSVDDLNK